MTPGLVHPAWKLGVWAIIDAVGALVLGAYGWLWWQHPAAAAPIAAYAVGLLCGLWLRDRRRKTVAVVAEWQGEEIDATKLAWMRRERHFVRISGEHPVIDDGLNMGPPAEPGPATGQAHDPVQLYDAAGDPAWTDTEARS